MKEIEKAAINRDVANRIKKIGHIIRQRRLTVGYTQQTLAFAILSEKSMISEIERGKYKNITICTLYKLAFILDMDIAEFFI